MNPLPAQTNAARAPESERVLAGIGLMVLATACFATVDISVKIASAVLPIVLVLWFRFAFQALTTTAILLPRYGLTLLRTTHPRYHLMRAISLLCTSTLGFLSLRYMPLAEYTAIVLIAPLVITVLAATTLKEQVSPLRWALVIGGFAGTLIILRPDGATFGWAVLLPIGLVLTNTTFQILTSKLAQTENPLTIHFYTGWVCFGLLSLMLPFGAIELPSWHWHWWALLCLMGLMGTLGHFMLILAFQRAPASTLSPYLYVQIGFAMLAGWVLFSRVPDGFSLLGIGLVAVCGAAGAWLTVKERRLPVEPAEP